MDGQYTSRVTRGGRTHARSRRLEILHVGSASRDIAPDDPRGWRLGGGVTYAALTTARLGLRTAALVGADAVAAHARELDELREAGVLVADPRRGHVTGLPQRRDARGPAPDLPRARHAARGRATCRRRGATPGRWSFAPVAGEVRDDWVDVIPEAAYVVVGWQGFLRDLAPGRAGPTSRTRAVGAARRGPISSG